MFALSRTVGWLAHWKEMIEDPDTRITRPRQLYVGPTQRSYVDVAARHTNGAPKTADTAATV
jgi:citrate synthase